MAFVNEYVSEEDVEKYELKKLKRSYTHSDWLPPGYRFTWTIDREREAFFMTVGGGREEAPNRLECTFVVQGTDIGVWIDKADESSRSTKDNPFIMVWDLAELFIPQKLNMAREDVIALLKEGLTVYGAGGIHTQIPNTLVRFKF